MKVVIVSVCVKHSMVSYKHYVSDKIGDFVVHTEWIFATD